MNDRRHLQVQLTLAAAFLLSFEYLFFTFSLLALLDVYFILFMVISLYFFLKNRFALSGATFALCILCKTTALFALPIFPVYFLYQNFSTFSEKWLKPVRWSKLAIWFGIFIPSLLGFLYVFDQIYSNLWFTDLRLFVLTPGGMDLSSLTQNITSERQYYSDPVTHLTYIFRTHTMAGWEQVSEPPPWLWLTVSRNYYLGTLSLFQNQFLEGYNPALIGLAFASIPVTFYTFIKNRERFSFFIFLWFAVTYFVWFPFYLLFTRPLYPFYILMTIPSICVSNCIFFRDKSPLLEVYILVILAYFILFQYPMRAIDLGI